MGALFVKLLDPKAKAPTVAHKGEDLGFDVYALHDVTLRPLHPTIVDTGIAVFYVGDNPNDTFGLEVKDRSSMAVKNHIEISAGVIDAGFRGQLGIVMTYVSSSASGENFWIKAGDKIAQILPRKVLTSPVVVVDELPDSARGENGFGSTGR